jgi:hypothetical protein
VLYPFAFDQPIAHAIANSAPLELRLEGGNQQFVALRSVMQG